MSVKSDIVKKLSPTQEEMTEVGMINDNGVIRWDISKESRIDFKFTVQEESIIRESLKNLDNSKSITDDIVDVYKLFL
jgi:hypothetical protein